MKNWLDSFNGIIPMEEKSKENQTNFGEIIVQLIDTMHENERLKKLLEPCEHASQSMIAHTPERDNFICNGCMAVFEKSY